MIRKISNRLLVLYSTTAIFLTVFIYYFLSTDLFITNSLQNLHKLGNAALNPRFDSLILRNILSGYQNAFLFAIVGLCIGIYLGLLLSYFSVRFRKFRIGKLIGITFRSTHEVVFMYLLILIFGLNPYIAIFAIGVSFGGIMGKIFTDNMNLTSDHHFLSYTNRGYSFRSNFVFHLFPSAFNSNLNYATYRFECAIRSSIILSYIGLPGIGFYLNNAMNDADYHSLFAYLYSLILFVLCFSILSNWLLKKTQYKISVFLTWFIPASFSVCLLFFFSFHQEFFNLFHHRNLYGLIRSGEAVVNIINPFNDTFYNADNMALFIKYTWQTVVLGMIATVFLFIFFTCMILWYFSAFVRGSSLYVKLNGIISIISRSIPEIVFLILLLFVMKPSMVTGALALALHNFGILTKLIIERIETNHDTVFATYKNRGYQSLGLFFFLFLPLLGKDLVSLLSYRFEMMIKSSVIVGLLGSGGLGYLMRLEMSKFNYEAIYFIVILYVAMFLVLDKVNSVIRSNA